MQYFFATIIFQIRIVFKAVGGILARFWQHRPIPKWRLKQTLDQSRTRRFSFQSSGLQLHLRLCPMCSGRGQLYHSGRGNFPCELFLAESVAAVPQ